jgi:hypothetical protein
MNRVVFNSIKNLLRINRINLPKIKIFGERNSGTIFLEKLIKNNIKGIHVCSGELNDGTGWKHGIPNNFYLNKLKGKVIYVIIFRELMTWLNSMYHRPYHIDKKSNFYEFIISKIHSTSQFDSDIKYLSWETSKNPFQLRYFKYIELMKLFCSKKNVVLVNLDWIQKDKGNDLINLLINNYGLSKRFPFFKPILKHTKTNRKTDNDKSYKKYGVPLEIFKKYVNPAIENKINNLTYTIKVNNSIELVSEKTN